MNTESGNIVKQFTKVIFPFRYNRKETNLGEATVTDGKGRVKRPFAPFGPKSEMLRAGIDELLSPNGGNTKIADCYELTQECRPSFGLPSREVDPVKFKTRYADNPEYTVTVEGVRLYLFESEVGFVELEFGYKSDKIEDYIECNYFISEIKSEKNVFEYERRISKDQSEKRSFTLRRLVSDVIRHVGGVRETDGDKFPEFKNCKGIIYSYILTKSEPENIEKLLFLFGRNFKGSYKVPEKLPVDRVTGEYKNVLQQFENSYWTATYNGAVNLSFCTGDETTDNFFRDNFYSKMRNNYFTLFLHALHQRFAVMKYIADMGELDFVGNDYVTMKRELNDAEKYYAEASNLKFRAFFKMPSTIEHVNEYYNLLIKTFNVDELKESFDNDLESIIGICKSYVMRIKSRDKTLEDRRKKKIEIFVSLFGTLVAVITLINSYWGLLEKLFGNTVSFWSIQIFVLLGALLVPIVTVIIDVVSNVKEIRKMTDDLKGEEEDGLVESDKIRKLRKKKSEKDDK